MGGKSISKVFMSLKFAVWKRNHRTSARYATNADPAPSNGCQISPGLRSHVSQGQAAIKDVSELSMKTGRAVLLQIFTNGESQAIQCAMRSHRSLSSEKFTSAKPVIDICQRERVVDVSSKAAGRLRKAGGSLKPERAKEYGHRCLKHSAESLMHLFPFSSWL